MITRYSWLQFQCDNVLKIRILIALVLVSTFCNPLLAKEAFKPSTVKTRSKIITVHEGTDLAITVSPDHKTIVMDLQGMLYTLPLTGGHAKQLTSPVQEASHPNWSPQGNLIAIQSYIGGTFHIWTIKPDGRGLKQLTYGHGDDREPSFSPDGELVAQIRTGG
jgi:Tol biopolymer transport system component